MSSPQRQSPARQASAHQANAKQAALRPPLREPEDESAQLLSFQAEFGNQVAKRAGDACPNLAACPTGGACHECEQKGAVQGNTVGEASAPAPATVPEASSPEPASVDTEPAAPVAAEAPVAESGSFLVDDPASATDPGQVGKANFLAELEARVTAAAEEELAGTGRTARDCPWIQYWFAYFEHRGAARLESALRRYAPEAAEARDASGYMPPVVERVRRAVAHWVATGEVTGVPDEGLASLAQLAATTGAGAVPASAAALMFKAREGGARAPADLEAMQARLGEGESLDAPVRSRMESVLGTSFGGVRVHRDAKAAALSSEVNARAFALGNHVAFGAGEYRPGHVIGDALIAHELAHVMQQEGGGSAGGSADYGSLEADADRSAAGAVSSLWSGARDGLAGMAARTGPALRSGLRLQRCKDEPKPEPKCANPGHKRSVELQPVFFRTGAADKAPTGTSWTRRFDAARPIWEKLAVAFTAKSAVTLDDAARKTAGSTDAEILDVMSTRTEAGIEIFFVDNDVAHQGGAATARKGSSDAQTLVSDRGTSDTLLAHELGHVVGLGHPPTDADDNTIMKPTSSHSVDNSKRNTMGNYNKITWPAKGDPTCLNPDT